MRIHEQNNLVIPEREVVKTTNKPFIEANTKEISLSHLREDCIIPVFSKDNETTISHQAFIEVAQDALHQVFGGEQIEDPEIRISHTVKGRIPTAIGKPVHELLPGEKTIYYERMMFAVEVPSITKDISGNRLSLSLGGVRAYNQENLYSKKSLEKFKFFIGFKNMVCCNMCISSDGYAGDLRVESTEDLLNKIIDIVDAFNVEEQLEHLKALEHLSLTDAQFAHFIGRSKMYQHLPKDEFEQIPRLLLNEGQITNIVKQYYVDDNFGRSSDGSLDLWNFFNLLTGANKSSYIDTFLDRSVNSLEIARMLSSALEKDSSSWYLN